MGINMKKIIILCLTATMLVFSSSHSTIPKPPSQSFFNGLHEITPLMLPDCVRLTLLVTGKEFPVAFTLTFNHESKLYITNLVNPNEERLSRETKIAILESLILLTQHSFPAELKFQEPLFYH